MFLGIDIGTGSTKAVLVDDTGVVRDTATREHAMCRPQPGWAEFDAEGVWWTEVCELSRELLDRRSGSDRALQGVCVSGMGPCLVLTGEDLVPLRPAILYGVDMRAHAEIEELEREFGADAIFGSGGSQLSSQAIGPKIRWVERNEPDVFAAATRFFSLNSFIVAKLTGAYIQDHHTASQSDPLYDMPAPGQSAGRWNTDRCAAVCRHLRLPDLAWPGDIVGVVTGPAAELSGIPEGTPVCAGTVDAWAEAFSAGVRRPGDTMLMYGSTFFVVQLLQTTQPHPMLWTTNGIDEGTVSRAAGMATSGLLVSWLRDLVGNPSFDDLVQDAAEVPPGADGLLILPYFAGERTPIFDPDARGVMLGLTLGHTRGHLLRAAYEGIAFGLRQILQVLQSGSEPAERLVAVGGGTRARLWMQVVSDITGREQDVPEQTIGASYGDALLAAIATGAVPAGTDWSRVADVIRPDPTTRSTYEKLADLYNRLYPETKDIMHELAALGRGSSPGAVLPPV